MVGHPHKQSSTPMGMEEVVGLLHGALRDTLRDQFAELSHQLREDVCRELQRSPPKHAHAPERHSVRSNEGHADGGSPAWGPLYVKRGIPTDDRGMFGAGARRSSRGSAASRSSAVAAGAVHHGPDGNGRLQEAGPPPTSAAGDLPQPPPRHGAPAGRERPGAPLCGNWVGDDGGDDADDLAAFASERSSGGTARATKSKLEVMEHAIGLRTARARMAEGAGAGDAGHSPMRIRVTRCVESDLFKLLTLALICASVAQIGIQTDYMARHTLHRVPPLYRAADILCCGLFALELALRVFAYRLRFFCMWGWFWNVLDSALVSAQITEEAMLLISASSGVTSHVGSSILLRTVRGLRVLRVMRVLRLLRFTEELQLLVSCILHSMQPFLWASTLLLIVVYVMAIYLAQVVLVYRLEHGQVVGGGGAGGEHPQSGASDAAVLTQWYGSVPVALLSIFLALTGGVDWNDIVAPLINLVSPWMGVWMVVFMLFTLLVVMNLVTSIFVQTAIERAAEVKEARHLDRAYEMFRALDADNSDAVCVSELARHLETDAVKDYFRCIDVDVSQAHFLFKLLDVNNSGTIDVEEFLSGCLRLQGPAMSIDLLLVSREIRYAFEQQHAKLTAMEDRLAAMPSELAENLPQVGGRPNSKSIEPPPRPEGAPAGEFV